MRLPGPCLSAIALIAIAAAPAFARLIESWPYERLFKEADLVVIARVERATETKERLSPADWKVEFIGQETVFTVQTILKGKVKDGRKLPVLHYRLPDDVLIENGPLLVSFRAEPLVLKGVVNGKAFKTTVGSPEYMLFLRVRPDGRFEPVSGQIDPALSVRELNEPDEFLSDLGRK
jgi:hypothetical protein